MIVADRVVHASIIDGIRLSGMQMGARYRHNDYQHLSIFAKTGGGLPTLLLLTESVFSMDGDIADLAALTALKQQYDNVLLYVDEAHAVGFSVKRAWYC